MGGYTACKKEFEGALRKITQLGYGIVLIAHNATRIEKTADGSEIEIISPELPKRAAEICNGIVDIIGYIGNEYKDGENHRYLYTRSTPSVQAGSRFKYLPARIPFGYKELTEALANAIEEEAKHGATVVDNNDKGVEETARSFDEVRAEAEKLWKELVDKDQNNAARIMAIAEKIFDRPIKLSEITPSQQDLFELVISGMKEL